MWRRSGRRRQRLSIATPALVAAARAAPRSATAKALPAPRRGPASTRRLQVWSKSRSSHTAPPGVTATWSLTRGPTRCGSARGATTRTWARSSTTRRPRRRRRPSAAARRSRRTRRGASRSPRASTGAVWRPPWRFSTTAIRCPSSPGTARSRQVAWTRLRFGASSAVSGAWRRSNVGERGWPWSCRRSVRSPTTSGRPCCRRRSSRRSRRSGRPSGRSGGRGPRSRASEGWSPSRS
mmetsp:Transcript_57860/g.167846  ORF Transcript_57860/g.167846 Transcript_57860/m.167846 type:complete len:237 (+) Transcript_57860:407-1117(+)